MANISRELGSRGALFQTLNPDLPTRPDFVAGQAVTSVTSPDGKTLLVLTSGFNRNNGPTGARVPGESNEYVFVYDISGQTPVKRQVLQVPNTFVGMAWHPAGKEFYVSGGRDDNVRIYAQVAGAWAEVAAVALGHAPTGAGNLGGLSINNRPNAAGLAVNADGTRLVVANHENDSVSVIDLGQRVKIAELDLRPGKISAADRGKPGSRSGWRLRVTARPTAAQNPTLPNDVDLLPGTTDVAAPDVEGAPGLGYLWDGALRAGLTVRNYGIYVDNINAVTATPFAHNVVQAVPTKAALKDNTDLFFRGYDQDNADFYLFKEWEREFDQYAAQGKLPSLSFVRFPHDHFGNFATAKFGVNTPDTQMADNDYALELLVEKVAKSRFKDDTLIVVIEDDAQNGPDHVDAHRSIIFFAGPFVKPGGAVISKRYTTVNAVRTIRSVLGITPLGITDGLAQPMTEVFDDVAQPWTYQAIVPEVLRTTQLPLPTRTADNSLPLPKSVLARTKPRGDADYWVKVMAGQNFEREDALDEPRYNRALSKGLKGTPYPAVRHGRDMSV